MQMIDIKSFFYSERLSLVAGFFMLLCICLITPIVSVANASDSKKDKSGFIEQLNNRVYCQISQRGRPQLLRVTPKRQRVIPVVRRIRILRARGNMRAVRRLRRLRRQCASAINNFLSSPDKPAEEIGEPTDDPINDFPEPPILPPDNSDNQDSEESMPEENDSPEDDESLSDPMPEDQIGTSSVKLSFEQLDFSPHIPGKPRRFQVLVKADSGSPVITESALLFGEHFSLASGEALDLAGGVPCEGQELDNFCSIHIKFDPPDSLQHEDVLILSVVDAVDGSITQQSYPIEAKDPATLPPNTELRTISIKTLALDAGYQKVGNYLKDELQKVLPNTFYGGSNEDPRVDYLMFSSYSNSNWDTNWTNSIFDLSMVAWDKKQAGTLVTPCHIVFAAHYPRSGSITFTAKDGYKFTTSIAQTLFSVAPSTNNPDADGFDIAVSRLSTCVDENKFPIATLPTPGDLIREDLAFTNAPLITTQWNNGESRRLSLYRFTNFLDLEGWAALGTDNVMLQSQSSGLYPSFMSTTSIAGSSGHPAFFYVDGRLVLATTAWMGWGWNRGPFFGNPEVFDWLQAAIDQLGVP